MNKQVKKTDPKIAKPKGRMLDAVAMAEVETMLGSMPRRRDMVIEALHRLQDRQGALHARHLKALATCFRLAEAEIFEVASFYHHFDIVKDGENAPAALTIRVCDSLSCMMAGAEDLIGKIETLVDPSAVRVVRAPCIGRCAQAPAAFAGRREVDHATAEGLLALAQAGETSPQIPAYRDLDAYRTDGGYQLLADCLSGKHTPEEIIALLSDSGLRGLGGAGFPSGRKWSIVRSYPAPRLMTINGDEGEPGTFKDRSYLEHDPHRMLEGALIAAWAVGCDRIYLYMRDEYPAVLQLLHTEITRLDAAGFTQQVGIELRRGAGAYICGEESAMIESIEGKRGLPRHRPPYIAEQGLFGRPTLNHNIETLFWVRDIVQKGPQWFAAQGVRGHKGMRSFSVSGRVNNPGVKLAPAGVTARELIEDYCGGMREGHRFTGYLPGGASGGLLPASLADEPLDFGTLDQYGCFVGSHAVVILSDHDDPKAVALNLLRFFELESCGQCTPCRSGTQMLVRMMEQGDWNPALMRDLDQVMRDASICGLGQAASNPVRSVLRFFLEETVS